MICYTVGKSLSPQTYFGQLKKYSTGRKMFLKIELLLFSIKRKMMCTHPTKLLAHKCYIIVGKGKYDTTKIKQNNLAKILLNSLY